MCTFNLMIAGSFFTFPHKFEFVLSFNILTLSLLRVHSLLNRMAAERDEKVTHKLET